MRRHLVTGLTALLSAGLLLACKKPETAQQLTSAKVEAPVKVETTAVDERMMPEQLVITGTLKASQESEVAADAAGKVTATFIERGQLVQQGATLAILDSRGASLVATAAQAQTQLARAQLEQAQRECERVKALRDTDAISKAEYDRVMAQCQTTQFSAAAAQAQQQNAQKIVGDAIIRAPFTGIVGERYVNVGQYVQPSTKVASLYAPDPLRLETTVPETSVAKVKTDVQLVFKVAAYGDEKFTGTVKFVAPNLRPSTRDMVIEAIVPNADRKLKPGMFAVASIPILEKTLPSVPQAALVKKPTDARVFVVANNRIEERIVQPGAEKDGRVAVLVGVKPGEKVVVSPGADVRDGATVQ
jgi:membrane fusion protein (multidrug efflux system)